MVVEIQMKLNEEKPKGEKSDKKFLQNVKLMTYNHINHVTYLIKLLSS
jgi:hypothetical protein